MIVRVGGGCEKGERGRASVWLDRGWDWEWHEIVGAPPHGWSVDIHHVVGPNSALWWRRLAPFGRPKRILMLIWEGVELMGLLPI